MDLFVSELTGYLFNVYLVDSGFKGEQAGAILARLSPVRVILVQRRTLPVRMR